jgi:hypothetical protein
MPRVRLTARGWRVFAVFAVGVCATPVLAAPPGKARATVAPSSGAAGSRPAESEARRRDEVEALQRQDIAEALKRHHNINVDWRTTPLDRLIDIRVRAAKAAELQERLGVTVDWQLYSWIELEALRRTLLSFERYRGDGAQATAAATPRPPEPLPASGADGLVRPTFKGRPAAAGGRSKDPDGIIKPTFTSRADAPTSASRDPDGVIRPTFAARPRWSSAGVDADGLIAPTFAPFRRFSPIGDADDLIDPTPMPMPTPTRALRPAPSRW